MFELQNTVFVIVVKVQQAHPRERGLAMYATRRHSRHQGGGREALTIVEHSGWDRCDGGDVVSDRVR